MYSDSLSSASINKAISMASTNPKDFAKKKRGNRSAKLKQCKLDARREQWLSQVIMKQKSLKEKPKGESTEVSKKHVNDPNDGSFEVSVNHPRDRTVEKLEIKPREKEKEENDGGSMNCSDSESSSNSPTSNISGGSDSGNTTFTESSISRSNSSSGCFSGIMSDDEDDDDDDDDDGGWEAIADALAATETKQEEDHKISPLESHSDDKWQSKPPISGGSVTFRPKSLPELSKNNQYKYRTNQESRRRRHVEAVWGIKNIISSAPISCPICCEDLDFTDSSFSSCRCEYKLCLFCYKRILEVDGRCPGCRKQYDPCLMESGHSCTLI